MVVTDKSFTSDQNSSTTTSSFPILVSPVQQQPSPSSPLVIQTQREEDFVSTSRSSSPSEKCHAINCHSNHSPTRIHSRISNKKKTPSSIRLDILNNAPPVDLPQFHYVAVALSPPSINSTSPGSVSTVPVGALSSSCRSSPTLITSPTNSLCSPSLKRRVSAPLSPIPPCQVKPDTISLTSSIVHEDSYSETEEYPSPEKFKLRRSGSSSSSSSSLALQQVNLTGVNPYPQPESPIKQLLLSANRLDEAVITEGEYDTEGVQSQVNVN